MFRSEMTVVLVHFLLKTGMGVTSDALAGSFKCPLVSSLAKGSFLKKGEDVTISKYLKS